MQKVPLKIQKLSHFKGELPRYETKSASGMDLRAQLGGEGSVRLEPGQRALVPTGLAVAIPDGFEIQIRPRSGWAIKQGISVVNSPGTVDADYRGEIKVILVNLGQDLVIINDQDRIAQAVLCPVVHAELQAVDSLDATERGAGGFGSTGVAPTAQA